MSHRVIHILLLLALLSGAARAATGNEARIGCLYPAGGQEGTTVRVMAAGQFLRGPAEVFISGEGVHGRIVKFYPSNGNLNQEKAQEVRGRLLDARDKLEGRPAGSTRERMRQQSPKAEKEPVREPNAPKTPNPAAERPFDHPLLYELEKKDMRELANIASVIFAPRKKQQQNRQLGEMVLIEITIDPNAAPGDRELRLLGGAGLTNPVVFQVGRLPEARELEPNAGETIPNMPGMGNLAKAAPIELPVTLNGQILPGDIDRFSLRARRGQQLVVRVHARGLMPYLADAVPGWFQATVTLYDSKGKEVAFADDYTFSPDPVTFYRVMADGEYTLEIRDRVYRGREDFVYRIDVGELPFVTEMFPLGVRKGTTVTASIQGYSLRSTRLPLEGKRGDESIQHTAYDLDRKRSNELAYAVDALPECEDTESNDTTAKAQPVKLPIAINGRIGRAGDVDVFRFEAVKDSEVVAEVCARRVGSPLDSLVRITDGDGGVIGWNDDSVVVDNYLYKDVTGLQTHQADTYLTVKLPKDGTYYAVLTDSQQHGGGAYAYRLRLSEPRPDFALRMTPSSLNAFPAGSTAFCVYALRKDGFTGPIEVTLADAPAGFAIAGGVIPEGRDRIFMTLTAPRMPMKQFELHLVGKAQVGKDTVSHDVVPSEDMMQAFLYRHLVPSQSLIVNVGKFGRGMPPARLATPSPVRIPSGGAAKVLLRLPGRQMPTGIELELSEPPKGISVQNIETTADGLSFEVKAQKDAQVAGYADNLIIEAYRMQTPQQAQGAAAAQPKRVAAGTLPAIPIIVVEPEGK